MQQKGGRASAGDGRLQQRTATSNALRTPKGEDPDEACESSGRESAAAHLRKFAAQGGTNALQVLATQNRGSSRRNSRDARRPATQEDCREATQKAAKSPERAQLANTLGGQTTAGSGAGNAKNLANGGTRPGGDGRRTEKVDETLVEGYFSEKNSVEDYIIGKQIGEGAYAVVRVGLHKPSGKKVALKIYKKFSLGSTTKPEG